MHKKKIGVVFVHGIGQQQKDFSAEMEDGLLENLPREIRDDVYFQEVLWAPVLAERERKLGKRVFVKGVHEDIRKFIVEFAADAVAYPINSGWIYRDVHRKFDEALAEVSKNTTKNAPLIVISHSLGTVVASNFFWDLQAYDPNPGPGKYPKLLAYPAPPDDDHVRWGRTLTLFYTMGSPLALWSLLFGREDSEHSPLFGTPISVPAPDSIFKDKLSGEWVNFYDKEDIIGYPLNQLNERYRNVRDVRVENKGFIGSLPVVGIRKAHEYWDNDDIAKQIAESLKRVWKESLHLEDE